MSSCSFISDGDDVASTGGDKVAMKQKQLELDHLTEVNTQLQNSIDSLKAQLKEAMDATASIGTMNNTITELKNQLAEYKEKEKNLTKELNAATTSAKEAEAKHQEDIQAVTAERDNLKAQLTAEADKYNKLRKERQQLKSQVEEKDTLLENCAMEIEETKTAKKKLRTKFATLGDKIQALETENAQLQVQITNAQNDKKALEQTIQALKAQSQAAQAGKEESEASINLLKKELEAKQHIINGFEEDLDSQREELIQMNSERDNIIGLVQKMHNGLQIAEQHIAKLTQENDSLNNKLKIQAKKAAKAVPATNDVAALTMPFEGEMGEKAAEYLKLQQYQPVQRAQLVINEAAKRLAEAENVAALKVQEVEELRNQLSAAVDGQTPYCQILDALLKELKNISSMESQINNAQYCKVDTAFIEFMAQKSAEIEPLIKEELLADPRFIPSDFFTTTDFNKRKEVIQDILKQNDMTGSILTASFLTNILLSNQLNALMGPLGQMEEISRLDVINGHDISDIPMLIQGLQAKIEKLKKQRTQVHNYLKKAQHDVQTLSKSENDLKTKVSQLQIQNESLTSENEVLKVKYQVANNELLLKKNEENLNQFAQKLKEEVDVQQCESKEKTDKLESLLQQKTKECADLTNLIKKLQITLDETTKKQNKRFAKNEETLKKQLLEMQEQMEMLEEQLEAKKRKAKKTEKTLREQYDHQLKEMAVRYEEGKEALNKTIEDLKAKSDEAREMTKKLQEQSQDNEQKNQKLSSDNAALLLEKKNLSAQLQQLKSQIQKEKQQLQVQLAAKMMACETKVQTATNEVRAQEEKKLKNLLNIVCEQLGSVYGFDDSDFTEESLKQVVAHAKEDLDRLHYFQNEATKI